MEMERAELLKFSEYRPLVPAQSGDAENSCAQQSDAGGLLRDA
jgi:hypothetical protein